VALREALQFPDSGLRRVCEPITEVTDFLRQRPRGTCEVLYYELRIDLAAPPLGDEGQLITVDTEWNEERAKHHPPIPFNPEFRFRRSRRCSPDGSM
jgi:peptide deformylase